MMASFFACVGSSLFWSLRYDVYGATLNDENSWIRQLERRSLSTFNAGWSLWIVGTCLLGWEITPYGAYVALAGISYVSAFVYLDHAKFKKMLSGMTASDLKEIVKPTTCNCTGEIRADSIYSVRDICRRIEQGESFIAGSDVIAILKSRGSISPNANNSPLDRPSCDQSNGVNGDPVPTDADQSSYGVTPEV
jgi:hypothetical protein